MNIDRNNVEQIVDQTLSVIIQQVENDHFPLSSEKTFVFRFAWELCKLLKNDEVKFDFEYVAYNDIHSSDKSDKYLDLLIWTDADYKIAFEFKLPKRVSSNSPQTVVKRKIYRDIARLQHLVSTNHYNIRAGFFICAVNEDAYLNQVRADPTYSISHDHTVTISEFDGMVLPESITFIWHGINKDQKKNKFARVGKFAWLEAIKIGINHHNEEADYVNL